MAGSVPMHATRESSRCRISLGGMTHASRESERLVALDGAPDLVSDYGVKPVPEEMVPPMASRTRQRS